MLWLVTLPLSAESALPVHPVQSYTAEYTVHLNGLKVGELHRRLAHQEDGYYLLETRAQTTGVAAWFKPDIAVETTRWHFVEGSPRPLTYTYHYTGRNEERLERLDFDWENGTLTSLRRGKTSQLELAPGVLDKQVFEIALQQAIGSGLKSDTFPVVSRGRITDYTFRVVGREEVVTKPFGTVETVKVKRDSTTLWMAPAQGYLVVKIQHDERGNTAMSYITSVQY
ncbi:MAG: DUF3108 domain-containing protein [Gammaproteobacteria bacterium]